MIWDYQIIGASPEKLFCQNGYRDNQSDWRAPRGATIVKDKAISTSDEKETEHRHRSKCNWYWLHSETTENPSFAYGWSSSSAVMVWFSRHACCRITAYGCWKHQASLELFLEQFKDFMMRRIMNWNGKWEYTLAIGYLSATVTWIWPSPSEPWFHKTAKSLCG